MNRKRRVIFAWAEVEGTSTLIHAGDVRSPTNLGHLSLPALRMWCLFTKPEQLPVSPCILPLKCCACGTPSFLGAAFPSSLALALQRLSPSSSGDSSPLLYESSSPADAFCPFKELLPVPASFADLASAVLAFQPGWQLPGSSCPSDAASVGKDKRTSCKRKPPSHTHTHAEKPPGSDGGRKLCCREARMQGSQPSSFTPHSSSCNWDAQTQPASAACTAPNPPSSHTRRQDAALVKAVGV